MKGGFQTLLQIVQNNYGMTWSFALTDFVGAALDLSGATLQFKGQIDSTYPVQFSGSMVVTNASGGLCSYTVQPTDFPLPGTWQAQVVVTFSPTEVLTFSDISIVVEAALPIS